MSDRQRLQCLSTEAIRAALAERAPAWRVHDGALVREYRFAGWMLDLGARHLVGADGVAVPLSSGEFRLLQALVEHGNRVMSRSGEFLRNNYFSMSYRDPERLLDLVRSMATGESIFV